MERLTYLNAISLLRVMRANFIRSNKNINEGGKLVFVSVAAQREFEKLGMLIDLFEVLGQDGYDTLVKRLERKLDFENSVQTLFQ